MNGSTVLLIALVILALVWAYSRQMFDRWLGLYTPHGATAAGPDTVIAHTGNGYGPSVATGFESGPLGGPSGWASSTRITRPTFDLAAMLP